MTGILVSFVGGSYGAKPSNTSAPVESGTAQFGSTLSVTTGCWTGAPTPTYSYQWYRGCTVVSGATSSTRTLAACCVGFAMKAKVTATNAIGCASAFSNSSSTVSALVPNAPTSVSASATSCSSISVSFTGSTCNGGASIDYYQVVCTSTGSHSTTGSSSPISVTGLSATTSYTFKVRAHNSKGYGSYSSSTGTATTNPVTGSSTYTSGGTYTFMKPSGVSTASLVAIGAGSIIGGGGGGGLGYINNASFCGSYSSFTIYVGTPGFYRCGGYGGTWACGLFSGQGNSYQGASGGGNDTNGGYGFAGAQVKHNGGSGSGYGGGGGGAAGYSGNGGHGSACGGTGTAGCGGGGGGGGGGGNIYYACCTHYYGAGGGGGGGVGIYGQGSSGSGGTGLSGLGGGTPSGNAGGGGAGSGGSSGTNASGSAYCNYRTATGGNGGSYGGAGGSGLSSCHVGTSAGGALRIIWPGSTRQYPSTCVGSP